MSETQPASLGTTYAALWRPGDPPPDVCEFLQRYPEAGLAEIVEVLLADQWRRHEAGCPLPAEHYLAAVSAVAADPERKLDVVYGEYRAACQFGHTPDTAPFIARFPELATAIRQHIALHDALGATGEWAHVSERECVAPTLPESMKDAADAGERVSPPGYELVRELGHGGFGSVWLARHVALEKFVAIKHLRPERVGAVGSELLVREARTMAGLKVHPNRVTVFDLIETKAGWFLVMDYVAGGTLGQLAASAPLDWVRAARYVAAVADGLAEVHSQGIWHRDIKPENILLDRERDDPLLTDFGLAAHSADASGCCGTPGYMAPELFSGTASEKTDIFALAGTLFHLVMGRKPFESRNLLDSRGEVERGLPEATLSSLPLGVAAVVRAGLDPNPERRPGLAAFTAILRGWHTQGLADRLRAQVGTATRPVKLNVTVSTANEKELVFRTVFSGSVTDGCPAIRCDEVVRLEAAADADGYLTILNLSSGGEVGVLFPNPRVPDNRVVAGRTQRLTVKLTPPAGTDHAVLVWTPGPCPLSAREWREQLEAGRLVFAPVHERGMEFVDIDSPAPATTDFMAAIVGIEHGN